jgi:hypothetical protein
MSELKGQLLGMLLVIGIFGIIWGVLSVSFQDAATDVGHQIQLDLSSQSSLVLSGASSKSNAFAS